MPRDTSAAKAVLQDLERVIASGRVGRAKENWYGADVVVTDTPPTPRDETGNSFYPEPRFLVTQYSRELSWLFEKLWWPTFQALFGPVKEEFFVGLVNAANRYLKRTDHESRRDLLGAVLHQAWVSVEQVEDGTFRALPVALGGEFYDDWIGDDEREDYMTVEETRRWFAERGFE